VNPDVCIGCKLCSWACPYGAREYDTSAGVMQKCTLCIDKIYDENIPQERRVPACVSTCPAGARHFGDFADPESNVSKRAAEFDGRELFPQMETKPVNKYLPPRKREKHEDRRLTPKVSTVKDALLKWAKLDFTG
ncbi:MAG TPA: 4Fe-4S binding protein, partial [Emcibacteraceae bacterium]|nr:4Fe-4S binding protein [Emcibacteraceae bacterium]